MRLLPIKKVPLHCAPVEEIEAPQGLKGVRRTLVLTLVGTCRPHHHATRILSVRRDTEHGRRPTRAPHAARCPHHVPQVLVARRAIMLHIHFVVDSVLLVLSSTGRGVHFVRLMVKIITITPMIVGIGVIEPSRRVTLLVVHLLFQKPPCRGLVLKVAPWINLYDDRPGRAARHHFSQLMILLARVQNLSTYRRGHLLHDQVARRVPIPLFIIMRGRC
mmetsp:Transcript_23244/g.58751  ORF Transcript_23244/g.58751 Transcript_23244/m.58751 type:complete len:218 (-) Transcript_23244:310-963(-)